MRQYSNSIGLVTEMIISNIWILTDHQNRRFVIDSGHITERLALAIGLYRAGIRKKGDLEAVLLTHRHTDHAGNALWMANKFDCPIYCHTNDGEILRGEKPAHKIKRGIGNVIDEAFCYLEDNYTEKIDSAKTFALGDWDYDFHIYPAFGHTEGSCLLYHKETKTLFSGDALVAGIPPLRFFEKLYLAIAAYSYDVEGCHDYVLDFLKDPPVIEQLCAGHGPLISQDVNLKIETLRQSLVA